MADADVQGWLGDAGLALGVPAAELLPEDGQAELLELTADIAHTVARLAVPLTSYLIGVAVGRGTSSPEALRAVAELLPEGER